MEAWIIDVLQAYGLAGLVIAGLVFDRTRLYNRNEQLNDKLHDTATRMANEQTAANVATATALERLSLTLRYQKLSSE